MNECQSTTKVSVYKSQTATALQYTNSSTNFHSNKINFSLKNKTKARDLTASGLTDVHKQKRTNWNGLTEVNARWNFCFAGSKARVAVVRPCAYLEKTRSEIFGSAPTTLPVPPRYVSLEGSKKNYSFSVCLLFYQYTSKNISIIIMFPNYFKELKCLTSDVISHIGLVSMVTGGF